MAHYIPLLEFTRFPTGVGLNAELSIDSLLDLDIPHRCEAESYDSISSMSEIACFPRLWG